MPISCHFWDRKALLVTSSRVKQRYSKYPTFTFTFTFSFLALGIALRTRWRQSECNAKPRGVSGTWSRLKCVPTLPLSFLRANTAESHTRTPYITWNVFIAVEFHRTYCIPIQQLRNKGSNYVWKMQNRKNKSCNPVPHSFNPAS